MSEKYIKKFIRNLLFIFSYLMIVFFFSFAISYALIVFAVHFTGIAGSDALMIAVITLTALVYSVFEFSRIYKEKWTPAIVIMSVLLYSAEKLGTEKRGQDESEYDVESVFQSVKFKNVLPDWN
ncbi:hypothetical protein MmiAt1_02780 [Methanimicrococcus sp. At1]|uniref:Uncharacterized protein n=1 Tax=Methanimicrococcus hacksteinii TaxID=3028293 RepID=A0ABU3VMW5_9EURY|nr:hypothetical protein [Methanimicrococcus sp. At1]MDV0444742.1 hypothetical protein [Methanimicrococcus sp. At1]